MARRWFSAEVATCPFYHFDFLAFNSKSSFCFCHVVHRGDLQKPFFEHMQCLMAGAKVGILCMRVPCVLGSCSSMRGAPLVCGVT